MQGSHVIVGLDTVGIGRLVAGRRKRSVAQQRHIRNILVFRNIEIGHCGTTLVTWVHREERRDRHRRMETRQFRSREVANQGRLLVERRRTT